MSASARGNGPHTSESVGDVRGDVPKAAPGMGPAIRALTREECESVLRRITVGRLAYVADRRVEILPIHYVFEDGWIYGRTSPGAKLEAWQHSPWLAFEVDEVRAPLDWTSVVAHGTVQLLDPETRPTDAAAWEHAITVLRHLMPDIGGARDSVPFRSVVFRLHADELDGRVAHPPLLA